MSLLRESIRRVLIQEKTIAQIVTSIEVTFNLEVDRKKHAFDRSTRPELEGTGYNQRPIENREIREVVMMAKSQIAEKIVNQEITPETEFVLKSLKWELAMAITPIHITGTYWELLIKTVFRESNNNPFRVGKDQLVIIVNDL